MGDNFDLAAACGDYLNGWDADDDDTDRVRAVYDAAARILDDEPANVTFLDPADEAVLALLAAADGTVGTFIAAADALRAAIAAANEVTP
jgi:hypothetical protein